jgi:hypothetical protein
MYRESVICNERLYMESLALARDFEDQHQPCTDQTDQTAPEFNDEQTAALRAVHIERIALRLLKGEPVSTYPLSEIAEALRTAVMAAAPVTMPRTRAWRDTPAQVARIVA